MKQILCVLMISAVAAGCTITHNWQGTSSAGKEEASNNKYGKRPHESEIGRFMKMLKEEIFNVSTAGLLERSLEIKNLAGSGMDISLIGKKNNRSYPEKLEDHQRNCCSLANNNCPVSNR